LQPCRCCKEHVYVFAVNGLNPMCSGNFSGLCCYLRKQGFENTYFGQLYSSHGFNDRIREIRAQDPQARIALIGFSYGANYVRHMVNFLAKDGTQVDLLIYLGGDTVLNTPYSYPCNVVRVLNVRARGLVLLGGDLFWNGADIDGARNCFVDCRHILIPSRRETLEVLMEELLTLACFPCVHPAPVGSVPAHLAPVSSAPAHLAPVSSSTNPIPVSSWTPYSPVPTGRTN
jgi:hypothetical protein